MALGIRVAVDAVVVEPLAVDVGSALAKDIVVGMKGVGVAVEEPCEDETTAAMPLAIWLT